MGTAKKAVKDWTHRGHRKIWNSLSGHKQAKALIQDPSANEAKEILKLNRN
jgi:hypothetical protein